MFTFSFILFVAARHLIQIDHRRKALAVTITLIISIIFLRIHSKKTTDSIQEYVYHVLQASQEIASANGPPIDEQ